MAALGLGLASRGVHRKPENFVIKWCWITCEVVVLWVVGWNSVARNEEKKLYNFWRLPWISSTRMACSAGCAHVVLVPTPVGGHCIPFFYLASRFAHLGLRVTFLVAEGLVPQLYTHKLFTPHVGLIQREGIEVLSVKDGFSHLGFGPGLMAVFREASEPQLVAGFSEGIATLMSSTKVPAPCCIVSDMLMGWTQIMAAKFNIPRFVLHTQSAANLSLMLHVTTHLTHAPTYASVFKCQCAQKPCLMWKSSRT